MRQETSCAQAGNRRDQATGAVSVPVYHASTFAHPALGSSTGYDYARTANPTRDALEEAVATLHHGTQGLAFASGMAAIDCVMRLFKPGDAILVSNDVYGGTYRLFEQVLKPLGIATTYVDTTDLDQLAAAVTSATAAIFIETPTNPTMRVTDVRACAQIAQRCGALLIVDNTFMTPYVQRPLDLGADIVVESATKYLGGHNDVLGGVIAVKEAVLAERLQFYQNTIGAVLGPDDAWLVLRGLKTLAVRMDRHQENATRIAAWLATHPSVRKVYYPGLADHRGQAVHRSQASGDGGMISFEVTDERMVAPLLAAVRVITFAESLGGVESLITYPVRQTHADIPESVRLQWSVTNHLLRLSVGIEHVEDLLIDLEQALEAARTACSSHVMSPRR